jgi:hypothetical protein
VAGLIAIAMLGVIVGGELDLDGFHRAAALVTAAMFAVGGVISFAGIRNSQHAQGEAQKEPAS